MRLTKVNSALTSVSNGGLDFVHFIYITRKPCSIVALDLLFAFVGYTCLWPTRKYVGLLDREILNKFTLGY
jgi:hypothetical protein